MFKQTLVALAAITALSAGPALASPLPKEPEGFSLAMALSAATRNNPEIQAAEARLVQARLDKETADLWWARSINANANYVVGNTGYYGNVTATGTVLPTAAVGVGVNLGDVLNGPKGSARAAQNVIIAEADLRRVTLAVSSNVTAAYEEYQAAKQVASMSGDTVQAAETDLRVMERAFERGQQQSNSLVDARLAVQKSRVDQLTGSGSVEKSWANLLSLMGDDHWVATQDGNGR